MGFYLNKSGPIYCSKTLFKKLKQGYSKTERDTICFNMNTNTTHETNILKSSRKTPEPAHFCNGIKRTAEKIQNTQINSTNKLRKVSEQQGVTYGIDDSRKEGKLQKLKMLLLDEDCKEFLQNLIAKKVDLLLHEKNIVPAPTKFESVVENCRVLERHFKNWGVFSNSLQERHITNLLLLSCCQELISYQVF